MNPSITSAVFPGQGSQRPGMGKDFFDNIRVSRDTYEEASEVLGWDVALRCFKENEKLDMTEYSQPCILTTEIAMLKALKEMFGFNPGFFGGHSLGEYTALVAAGVMPFSRAVTAVQLRGRLMQAASPPGTGSMAAVIMENADADQIRDLIKDFPLDTANINASDQIVISGASCYMSAAEKLLFEKLGKETSIRFVPLNVSAAFHSRLMAPVGEDFQKALEAFSTELSPENACRVTANFSGGFHSDDRQEIIDSLVSQLSHPVQWQQNMEALSQKTQQIYEIGPGRPLRGFFKGQGIQCSSITTLSAAKRAFKNSGS